MILYLGEPLFIVKIFAMYTFQVFVQRNKIACKMKETRALSPVALSLF